MYNTLELSPDGLYWKVREKQIKYEVGDKVVVVSNGGGVDHRHTVGEVYTYMGESNNYGGSLVVDGEGLRQFLLPQQVLPYYDLNKVHFDYDQAKMGHKSSAFLWSKTPEGTDYWMSQQYNLTPEGQEKLDAMIELYEFYESRKVVPTDNGDVSDIMKKLEDCVNAKVKDYDPDSEPQPLMWGGYVVDTPDGGPQAYYDLPPDAITLNDLIEFKSYNQWLGDTAHLFNIFKAAWRWGIKEGTSKEYDARKFIYSGARLLMYYAGVEATRETLQKMLDDPQFNNKVK